MVWGCDYVLHLLLPCEVESGGDGKEKEDDAKMDADGNDHISPAMHLSAMPPKPSPVNSDGFLVPPPAFDDAKRSINECFIGSNIVRHRNNKLS